MWGCATAEGEKKTSRTMVLATCDEKKVDIPGGCGRFGPLVGNTWGPSLHCHFGWVLFALIAAKIQYGYHIPTKMGHVVTSMER